MEREEHNIFMILVKGQRNFLLGHLVDFARQVGKPARNVLSFRPTEISLTPPHSSANCLSTCIVGFQIEVRIKIVIAAF